MKKLLIYIEIEGEQRFVGGIDGSSYHDAVFSYADEYLDSKYAAPISISMPLQREAFSVKQTRNFFEGLLPEGFPRREIAGYIKTDEQDYLSILASLGNECLGAIKVVQEDVISESARYESLSMEQVKILAEEGATKSTQLLLETHLSLTGASGKVGLYYDENNWYLPKGDAPSTHIVKQSHVRYSRIVLNEQLCLNTAREIGLQVPDSFIINIGNGDDSDILFATRRYDREFWDNERIISGLKTPYRLHQEDFSQALNIPSYEKYEREDRGYLERMISLIRHKCVDPIGDQEKFWKLVCFNFLIGNTDCHIKNYSLIYSSDLRGIRLAPAYDLISTRVYDITKEMSFYIGGELDIERMNRHTFMIAAERIGLPLVRAMKIFDDTANDFEKALERSAEKLKEEGFAGVDDIKNAVLHRGGIANIG